MANTSSAKKMVRKILKRTSVNKSRLTAMKTALKKVTYSIEEGNHENATKALISAQPVVARAMRNNIIHKNTAARKISRLNKKIKQLSSS